MIILWWFMAGHPGRDVQRVNVLFCLSSRKVHDEGMSEKNQVSMLGAALLVIIIVIVMASRGNFRSNESLIKESLLPPSGQR
jgi:hypothetical protein